MNRLRHERHPRRFFFRGEEVSARRIAKIGEIIGGERNASRQALASEICRAFSWRCSNGTLAVRAARDLLIRLERAGVVELPEPRRRQGRPKTNALAAAASETPRTASSIAQPTAASSNSLLVRPIIDSERPEWRVLMERFHYLGDVPLIGESLRYVAELDGERVALLGWSAAALHNGPRDRLLGWDETAKRMRLNLVVNNSRFLMLNRRPHLASRVLGANLRRISRDWENVYGHRVVLAETFVDTSRFRGTCYRASNWLPVGETKGWSKRGSAYRFNGQPKAVWLYPLTRDFKEQLRAGTPTDVRKEHRMIALDVERLPLEGQGGLFEVLKEIADPRHRRGVRHKLHGILAAGICAVLAGARSFTAMGEWTAEQSPETLKRFGSKRGKPPSERTFRRAFSTINAEEFDRKTCEWVARQEQLLSGMGLCLDGKTARGSRDGDKKAIQLLSAIVRGSGTVIAQVEVESKTNEIPMVEPLLKNLDIKGVVVTADALHTQKSTAAYLVEEKEAHYAFTVKDNQPTLKQDIETLGLDAFSPSAQN